MSGVLHHLAWNALEASLLAAVILLATRLRATSAPVRHALWLLVAVKLLLPPIGIPGAGLRDVLRDAFRSMAAGIAPRPATSTLPGSPVDAPAVAEGLLPAFVVEDEGSTLLSPEDGVAAGAAAPGAAAEAIGGAAPPADAPVPVPRASPPFDLESAAALLWLAGAAIILVLRARRILALRALLRAAEDAPADVLDACRDLAARLGIREPPRVLIAPWPTSPFLSAAGAPAIVLPACLIEPAGRGALAAVLAHELGHLKRRDHWASWVDFLATAAFWWLPAAWIAGRAMERASDEAADACAAMALGSRREYAAALVETLDVLVWNQAPLAIPGRGLGEREAVERRLIMVLRHPLFTGLSLRSRIAIAALGLLILPAAPGLAPGQSDADVEPIPVPVAEPAVADPGGRPDSAASGGFPPPEAASALADPSTDAAPPALPGSSAGSRRRGPARDRGDRYGTAGSWPESAPPGLEERLSEVERKVDRILHEMERLTRAVSQDRYPQPAPAVSGRADAGGSDGYRDPRAGPVPRTTTPRASRGTARAGNWPAIAEPEQPGQPAAPLTRGKSERLRAIERRFEERARALRRELAALEAALEEEMRAADPDAGDALPPADVFDVVPYRNEPGAAEPPRSPGAPGPVSPLNPVQPPQPIHPAQPASAPSASN